MSNTHEPPKRKLSSDLTSESIKRRALGTAEPDALLLDIEPLADQAAIDERFFADSYDGFSLDTASLFMQQVISGQMVYEVLSHERVRLNQSYSNNDEFKRLFSNHPELKPVFADALNRKTLVDVRRLKLLASPEPFRGTPSVIRLPSSTAMAFNREYVSGAEVLLWDFINFHYHMEYCAHIATFCQSSGTGKSRSVHELGKKHFVIPLNLREDGKTGYPPADRDAADYLSKAESQSDATLRSYAFLVALFQQSHAVLQEIQLGLCEGKTERQEAIASAFSRYMTYGYDFDRHNQNRREFYSEVVSKAQKLAEAYTLVQVKFPELGISYYEVSGSGGQVTNDLDEAVKALVSLLRGQAGSKSESSVLRRQGLPPDSQSDEQRPSHKVEIILAFDDAHSLTRGRYDKTRDVFCISIELCRILNRYLLKYPIFSLFLSTTEHLISVSRGTRRIRKDHSSQIESSVLQVPDPFVTLGFDQLAPRIQATGWTLSKVASNDYISHLGRPLWGSYYDAERDQGGQSFCWDVAYFTAQKMSGLIPNQWRTLKPLSADVAFAALSHRIPLMFHDVTYPNASGDDTDSGNDLVLNATDLEKQKIQVESHMGICLNVGKGFRNMVTTSPSEPLLSEAGVLILKDNLGLSYPAALQMIFSEFSVHRGDHGELVVLLLLTMARDATVSLVRRFHDGECRVFDLESFIRQLFTEKNAELVLGATPSNIHPMSSVGATTTLRELFKRSRMHFNHFVKLQQHDCMNIENLFWLIFRGAAVAAGDDHPGIDGAALFTLDGEEIRRGNIGAILWQVQVDTSYTDTPRRALFDAMDHDVCQLLDAESDEDIPVIRIVFILATKDAGIGRQVNPCIKISKPGLKDRKCRWTTYDVWCYGISYENFTPVEGTEMKIWDSLIRESYGLHGLYDSPFGDLERRLKDMQMKMSMNPGAGTDTSFWKSWVPVP